MYIYSLEGVNVHLRKYAFSPVAIEFSCVKMARCSLHPARWKLHRFILEASKVYVVLCVLWRGFALFVMCFFVCIPLSKCNCIWYSCLFCGLFGCVCVSVVSVCYCLFCVITCLYDVCGLLLVCWIAFGCGPCCGRGLPRSFYPDLLYCI